MTYIENIFLCLAIPMILSLFFIKGRSRSYILFVTIGIGDLSVECLCQQHFLCGYTAWMEQLPLLRSRLYVKNY